MPMELICPEHAKVALRDYQLPDQLKSGQVLVRNTHGAEKHGTMTSFYRGYANQRGRWDREKQMHVGGGIQWQYPIPLGNMQVGFVERVGPDVDRLKVGDRVVHYGNFKPSAVVRADGLWKLHEQTSWKAAVCLDPATYALCAIRDGNLRIGDAVAIFSLGAIGLMAVQLAKAAGVSLVAAIDPLENRRAVARQTGADLVIDPTGNDVGYLLREATGWRGVDVVLEYSGAAEALQAALRGVAYGGNVVAGAFPPPYKAGLDFGAEAHMNRPQIIFSRSESDPGRDHPRWDNARVRDTVSRLILDGRLDCEGVVDPVVPFDQNLPEEYLKIATEPHKNIKFGVEYRQ